MFAPLLAPAARLDARMRTGFGPGSFKLRAKLAVISILMRTQHVTCERTFRAQPREEWLCPFVLRNTPQLCAAHNFAAVGLKPIRHGRPVRAVRSLWMSDCRALLPEQT
jgi:hypothetical protein